MNDVSELTAEEAEETRPCACTEEGCGCGEPVGGMLWKSQEGSCWECFHGRHRSGAVIVSGLDLSLTSTGAARLNLAQGTAELTRLRTRLRGHDRLDYLLAGVDAWTHDSDLVAMEGPSYGSMSGRGHHEGAGLWWLVAHRLYRAGRQVAVVSPSALKIYATGRGNAGKDEVLAAVVRRYPAAPVEGNDQADALVLAAMCAHHLGSPLVSLPQKQVRALASVDWPALETDRRTDMAH
jgi:Holliday junction resolvasome RuvABC endonuclease subunit